ncbi:MAG: Gfo/Idh/MocA family oxidoreductase [Kiritimatiellae bacterium]|nr:Gfo/Idh/MocA family oxidoreductase [Kiritimatiellia bacterium]
MEMGRRDFLSFIMMAGATAAANNRVLAAVTGQSHAGSMAMFAAPPLRELRVAFVGLGKRGPGAVHRFSAFPGVKITHLCDLYKNRAERQNAWLVKNKRPAAKIHFGAEGWKQMLEADDIDLVYNVTPWYLHTPIAVAAMKHGKHVAVEVPAALTIEECWQLVDTSEETGRHCMMLENCCYGEVEMLALRMAREGMFGEIVHGEGAYIHDLRAENYADLNKGGYYDYWRLKHNTAHTGNPYPTHGLGPICQVMDINRGDVMEYLVSVSSRQAGMSEYAAAKFPGSWKAKLAPALGDMNTTVIGTAKGRSIMIQHDVTSPRPYSRINLISGTRGILADYPLRMAFDPGRRGGHSHWLNDKELKKIAAEKRHPLWKSAGEIAKKIGGHGGMDFLMDLRLCYCLQNGLALDQNVYDAAAWSSLCELTEKSARHRGATQDIPDFTRGAWKTTPPLGIVDVDLGKMGLDGGSVKKDGAQLSV